MNRTAVLAQSLANANWGMAVGGDDDPSSGVGMEVENLQRLSEVIQAGPR